jgi:hypothetical protein
MLVSALVIVTELGQGQARPGFEAADSAPSFEVATVKRSAPDSDACMQAHPKGRLEISGGPAWVRSEYFSSAAKAAETRPLVGGRSEKNTPAGLQATTEGGCVRVENAEPPDPSACASIGMGLNHLEAREISMARLAEVLSRALDRQVIDKTGRSEKLNHAEEPSEN